MSGDGAQAVSAGVQRGAALGVLVALAALTWGALINPATSWVADRVEGLAEARFERQRATQAVSKLAAVTPAQVALAHAQLQSFVVPAPAPTQAGVALQQALAALARKAGVAANFSGAPATVRDIQGAKHVVVQLRVADTQARVIDLLFAIERARPMMRIERVSLEQSGAAAMPGAPETAAGLAAVVVVSAVWIAAPAPRAPSAAGGQQTSRTAGAASQPGRSEAAPAAPASAQQP